MGKLDINLFRKLIKKSEEEERSAAQKKPIKDKNENSIEVDISEQLQIPILKSQRNNIYYLEGDWLKMDLPRDFKEVVYSALQYSRPEMLFIQLFSLIVKKNFNARNKPVPSIDAVLNLYFQFSAHILRKYCKIDHPQMVDALSNTEWNRLGVDMDDFIDGMKTSILDYVAYHKDMINKLGLQPGDILYFHSEGIKLFQTVMLAGYGIATRRILDEVANDQYIGAEVIEYFGSQELLIYFTPLGIIKHKEIIGPKFNEGIEYYYRFLKDNNMEVIESSYLKKLMNSRQIIEFNKKTYVHLRKVHDHSNDFIVNRLNKPWDASIMAEKQINLKLVEV